MNPGAVYTDICKSLVEQRVNFNVAESVGD